MLLGAIEAGGTKFVCSVGTEDLNIVERVSYPTTTPNETMRLVISFFKKYEKELKAIGIGSFGPIDIHKESSTYGFITSTPKLAWQNFNFVGEMKQNFSVPIAWTTDVNAAAYGEYIKGHGQSLTSVVYFTIGTGIGGGAIQQGDFIEGFSHPEMGHMLIRRHKEDTFEGACPFHKDCLEGMAAGPAIEKRLGIRGQDLSKDNLYWDIQAYYIAQCAYNTTLQLSPDVIIFGGGVMKQSHMLQKVRQSLKELINNYVKLPDLDKYIVTPLLEDNAGTIGCLGLAKKAMH